MRQIAKVRDTARGSPIEGIDEKDFILLYNAGKVRKLDAGQVLFTEGESDETVFLVLKGVLQTVSANGERADDATVFREGDWVGELVFLKSPHRISTVGAIEPSSILVLDASAFKSLDQKFQTLIWKSLNNRMAYRNYKLARSKACVISANHYLTDFARNSIQKRTKEYNTAESVQNLLKNIPRLPMYTTRLINLLQEENASIKEITRLAKEDPSLVSEVLKVVNSPFYGLRRKISDLHYAIVYLGFNQVYQLLISNGLRGTMPDSQEFQGLQQHSILISYVAYEICQLYDRRKATTVSTVALLHDIGKSVTLLLKKQNPRWGIFIDMLDQAKIGSMLLREWNIPDLIHECIEYQSYPEFAPPLEIPTEHKDYIAVLFIAHAVHDFVRGNFSGVLQNPFIGDYMEVLGFSRISISDLAEKYVLGDLNLKISSLPKHVQNFILSRAGTCGAGLRK